MAAVQPAPVKPKPASPLPRRPPLTPRRRSRCRRPRPNMSFRSARRRTRPRRSRASPTCSRNIRRCSPVIGRWCRRPISAPRASGIGLRIGPIADKTAATKLCSQLKSQGLPDCLVDDAIDGFAAVGLDLAPRRTLAPRRGPQSLHLGLRRHVLERRRTARSSPRRVPAASSSSPAIARRPTSFAPSSPSFKDAVESDEVLVLIDQEGGRVQRLRPPHWRDMPPARCYGRALRERPRGGERRRPSPARG